MAPLTTTTAAVTITTPPDGLVDDPDGIAVTGCPPGAPVVLRASVDAAGGRYESSALIDADPSGTVDTARHASRGGTYRGIDPFGLFWSGEPAGPSDVPTSAAVRYRLAIEIAGRPAAEVVHQRRWLGPGATLQEVHEPGVVGLFALPGGTGPFPAVVAFAGSSGGLAGAAQWAPVLASHGLATLAIAYFGAPGLPSALVGIEVEVVERAIGWLRRRADLDTTRGVGVLGMSRGSELALLAGALVDEVGAVVAFTPSGISWCGLGPTGPVDAPAWTWRGRPVPYARLAQPHVTPPPGPFALRPLFEQALANEAAVGAAEIPVERIPGPALLVSGEDDAMWPATRFAQRVVERAARDGDPRRVTHLSYRGAGHTAGGVPGLPTATEIRHPLDGGWYDLGGTVAANAAARADSWPRVLAVLAGGRH